MIKHSHCLHNAVYVILISIVFICGASSVSNATTIKANGTYHPGFYKRFSDLETKTLLDKGYDYLSDNSKIDSALVCYSIVANRWDEASVLRPSASEASTAFVNLGNMYMLYYTDYRKAYKYLLRAEKIIEDNKGCNYSLGYLYLSLANIFQIQAGPRVASKEARDYLVRCFDEAIRNSDRELASACFINLMNVSFSPETPNAAMLRKPLQRLDSLGIPSSMPERDFTLCLIDAARRWIDGDRDGVIRCLEKAVTLEMDPHASDRTEMVASQMLLRMLHMNGRLDKVPGVLDRMLATARISGSYDLLSNVYALYSDYYKKIGDTVKSREYRYLYLDQADSLKIKGEIDGIDEMRFLNDLEEVNRQVKDLSYKRRVQSVVICCAAVLFLMLMIFTVFMINAYRREKEKNRILYESSLQRLQEPAKVGIDSSDATEEEESLFGKIKEVMESSDAIYSSDFNRQELAAIVGASYTKVSAAINKCSGMSFSALLADYRIREAQRRLGDREVMATRTIESIAVELGFQSRTNFAALFKKIVGMSPSAYIKESQRS